MFSLSNPVHYVLATCAITPSPGYSWHSRVAPGRLSVPGNVISPFRRDPAARTDERRALFCCGWKTRGTTCRVDATPCAREPAETVADRRDSRGFFPLICNVHRAPNVCCSHRRDENGRKVHWSSHLRHEHPSLDDASKSHDPQLCTRRQSTVEGNKPGPEAGHSKDVPRHLHTAGQSS